MNKKELVKNMSGQIKLSQKDCLSAVNAITNLIYDALKRGEKVILTGFGKFEVRDRAERETVNPQTGKKMVIPQQKVPSFKTGRTFKSAIR